MTAELERLRQRVQRQRVELRRLNRVLGPYWAGFRRGTAFEGELELRVKILNAFGSEKVWAAEHCNCGQNQRGERPAGWNCPTHGEQQ